MMLILFFSHLFHICFTFVSHLFYLFHSCFTVVSYWFHLFHICFTFVSHLFHIGFICFTFVSHLFHICFTFVSHLFHICLIINRYTVTIFIYLIKFSKLIDFTDNVWQRSWLMQNATPQALWFDHPVRHNKKTPPGSFFCIFSFNNTV
jgi:hypothetical protein